MRMVVMQTLLSVHRQGDVFKDRRAPEATSAKERPHIPGNFIAV